MDVRRNTCCLRAVLFLGLARLVCSAGEPDRAQALIERLADARPAARERASKK